MSEPPGTSDIVRQMQRSAVALLESRGWARDPDADLWRHPEKADGAPTGTYDALLIETRAGAADAG